MLSLKNNLFSKKSLIIVVSILFVLALFSDVRAVPVFEDGFGVVGSNTIDFGEYLGTASAATSTKISQTGFWSLFDNDFVVGTNNTERLRIATSGNVFFGNNVNKIVILSTSTNIGLGTTNPQKQLHIKGSGIRYEREGGTTAWDTVIDNSSNFIFYAGAMNRLMFSWGGNIGVGTTSLTHKLNVNGNVNATGFTINGVAIGGGGGGQWTTNGSSIYYNAGSVGLGTISPSYKLHLFDSSSGPIMGLSGVTTNYRGLAIRDTSVPELEKWFYGANDFNNFVIRRGGSSDDLTINDWTGNVGIGTTTSATYKLNVGGAVNATQFLVNGVPITSGSGSSSPAVYVTSTPLAYTGSGVGGYLGANTKCNAVVAGSHMCLPYEIANTVNAGLIGNIPGYKAMWLGTHYIDTSLEYVGSDDFTTSVSNDCNAWTIDSPPAGEIRRGFVLYKTNQLLYFYSGCANTKYIACCK